MSFPKVLFRVDANPQIGWGHFYRSLSLALMLRDSFSVSFAMAMPDSTIKEILKDYAFELLLLEAQAYSKPEDRGNTEFEFDLGKHIVSYQIIVLDGYWFGNNYQSQLRSYPIKVVVIEDNGSGTYMADVLINHAPGLKSQNYDIDNSDVTFALGPDYALLRPAFLESARSRHNYQFGIDTDQVFICFGGSDHYDFSGLFADLIIKNTLMTVNIVIGVGYRFESKLKELGRLHKGRVKIMSNLNEGKMLSLMRDCKFGIVPSSGILFECLAARLPVFCGYYTENQEAIYGGWLKTEAIVPLGNLKNIQTKLFINELQGKDYVYIKNIQAEVLDGRSKERYHRIFNSLLI